MWLVAIHSVSGNLPFHITPGEFLVGRTNRAHIVLAEPTISRQHARLCRDGTRITVQDLGSANGTFVNEIAANNGTVYLGDHVRFGSVTCVICPTPLLPAVEERESTYPIPLPQANGDATLTGQLTEAQLKIVPLLMKGMSEPEIAAALDRSPHTIHAHVRAIFGKAGVHSREELIVRLLHSENQKTRRI